MVNGITFIDLHMVFGYLKTTYTYLNMVVINDIISYVYEIRPYFINHKVNIRSFSCLARVNEQPDRVHVRN